MAVPLWLCPLLLPFLLDHFVSPSVCVVCSCSEWPGVQAIPPYRVRGRLYGKPCAGEARRESGIGPPGW